jgi:NAD(P)-dependent dehydrogenase (short-subunit alcohol dehydrogenase family)
MKDTAGKVAVVTGGTSGIGLGIALALLEAGMRVVITYRRDEQLQQALRLLHAFPPAMVHSVAMDVTDRGAVAAAADEVQAVFGKVHLLCNSAGICAFGSLERATHADWDGVMGVNVGGIVNVLLAFLPLIMQHGEGGHIVNVGSMASFIAGSEAGIYTTSKFAVRGLTESLRLALAGHRIGVSLVCPGLTNTNIWQSASSKARITRQGLNVSEKTARAIYSLGMDPVEVGRRTLKGIVRNDLYIFTHPEFRRELEEIHAEVLAAFPNEEVDPRRLVVEEARRRAKAYQRRKSDEI